MSEDLSNNEKWKKLRGVGDWVTKEDIKQGDQLCH